jgi:hypothetical protein
MSIKVKPNPQADAKALVREFLLDQLNWINSILLKLSVQAAASGDSWTWGQYHYYKQYRSNVQHLLYLNADGHEKRKHKRIA